MAVLGVLGTWNMHQRNFPLFLGVVLGVSIVIVVVFISTASREPSE